VRSVELRLVLAVAVPVAAVALLAAVLRPGAAPLHLGLLQAGALLVVIAAVLVVAVRLQVTGRLARLAAVMRQAASGDLVVRAPEFGEDEVGQLARAFNALLVRLTEFKAEEIDRRRDLERAQVELQLQGQLQHRLEELQTLYEVARAIASTLELGEVLSRIAQVVPGRLEVERFSAMLVDADGQLEVVKIHPAQPGHEGVYRPLEEGPWSEAAASRQPRAAAGTGGQGSLLAVPMVHGDQLLGVLTFERAGVAAFPPDQAELFQAIAAQAAIAVQNARLHERTVALSVTDPLTGAPNRRHLFTQLGAEIDRSRRYGTPLSLLMVDIDHFKHLNDIAGHRAGDEVLRQVCGVLRRSIRKVDTLARYGGEEFVILLPQLARPLAVEVAEKLRAAVAEAPLDHGARQPAGRVTVSIGVASLPADAAEAGALVDCADAALYASKHRGRNAVTGYAPGMELDPGRERGALAQERRGGEAPT
jgi:diguanylate cyclase (GGDEF)-like protein